MQFMFTSGGNSVTLFPKSRSLRETATFPNKKFEVMPAVGNDITKVLEKSSVNYRIFLSAIFCPQHERQPEAVVIDGFHC